MTSVNAETESLESRAVFLSASIPDPERWSGSFDAYEVTDAVVAFGRAVLGAGGVLVTAAHPTIAPLLLYIAAELPVESARDRVIVYQSDLFERVLPAPTLRFEEAGVGELRWTPAAEGDTPEPGSWDNSLRTMRRQMLEEADPVAAVFIGGMEGIRDEFELFGEMYPDRPLYPVGRPGGEAADLAETQELRIPDLHDGDVYPALFRRVVADIATDPASLRATTSRQPSPRPQPSSRSSRSRRHPSSRTRSSRRAVGSIPTNPCHR